MLTSPRYQIAYPNPDRSDSADVPRDIGQVVAAVEKSVMYGQGAIAARPVSTSGSPGIQGRVYYATDEGLLYWDTGTGWNTVVPAILPGFEAMWAGATAPAGWALEEGQAISRTTYAALFAVVGTLYGVGDGSTTFNLPNSKGRTPVGRDTGQAEFDALGEAGGVKTVALSAAEMPNHAHLVNSHSHGGGTYGANADMSVAADGSHTHGATAWNFAAADGTATTQGGTGRQSVLGQTGTASAGYHGHGLYQNPHGHGIPAEAPATDGRGGGAAHSNLQPYVVKNFIIKL
jgi:microcystin-dependent protein